MNKTKENLIKTIDEIAGIWKDRTEDIEKTVRDLRKEELKNPDISL
ncbi:hypothetical protein [Persephonella sp.]